MGDMGVVARPGTGRLRLTMQKSALTWGALLTPQVRVNGYPIPARWGENVYDLWVGPNAVDISCQYLWSYGQASARVDVQEGQEQQLFYAPPMFTFMRGRIGPARQRLPGMVGFWAFFGTVGLLALTLVLAAVLQSPTG